MTVFQCTPKVISGEHALESLREIHSERVFLVTDSYFSKTGTALKIAGMIPGANVTVFDKVVPDPPASLSAEGAAICMMEKPDILLALGGGSAIDCAKGIRAACEWDMTFIAVPTTSGSGSEMTSYAILTENHVKHPLVDASLRPDITILDDQLLMELPPSLIADSGMDLLAHCLEALVAVNHGGFTDALAMHGIQTVFQYLARSHGGDTTVRMKLHEAASMAGAAFESAGLGLCHALAHSIGGTFAIPHGRLCGILLPSVISCNAAAVLEQYAAAAKRCGMHAPTDRLALRSLLNEICRLRKELRLPETLRQAGIDKNEWEQKRSAVIRAAVQDPCCETNPVPATEELAAFVLKAVEP